jgi:hypothetical protein
MTFFLFCFFSQRSAQNVAVIKAGMASQLSDGYLKDNGSNTTRHGAVYDHDTVRCSCLLWSC